MILALILALSFAGCASPADEKTLPEELPPAEPVAEAPPEAVTGSDAPVEATEILSPEKLVGKWVSGEVSVGETMLAAMGVEEAALDFIDADDLALAEIMEFSKDGTVTETLDPAVYEPRLDAFMESFRSGYLAYFVFSVEQTAEQNGFSYEHLLSYLGVSEDEEMFEQFVGSTPDDYCRTLKENIRTELQNVRFTGTYAVEDGKLCVYAGDACRYAEYDAAADTLTFSGEGADDPFGIYPLTFHR